MVGKCDGFVHAASPNGDLVTHPTPHATGLEPSCSGIRTQFEHRSANGTPERNFLKNIFSEFFFRKIFLPAAELELNALPLALKVPYPGHNEKVDAQIST